MTSAASETSPAMTSSASGTSLTNAALESDPDVNDSCNDDVYSSFDGATEDDSHGEEEDGVEIHSTTESISSSKSSNAQGQLENSSTLRPDEPVPIVASYDMGWAKCGRAMNSTSGVGAMIDRLALR